MSGAERLSITTPGGTRIELSSSSDASKTIVSQDPATKTQPAKPSKEAKIASLQQKLSQEQAPRILSGHEDVKSGLRADDLDLRHEELGFEELIERFTKPELSTVKKAADQLSQTRVNREDSQSEAFLSAMEVLALAIKSHLNNDDKDLETNFSNSSLAKHLANLYDQDFLNNLMAIRANRIEASEFKDAATNLLTYLNRAASVEKPESTEKAPF